jgi:hypothetical protein
MNILARRTATKLIEANCTQLAVGDAAKFATFIENIMNEAAADLLAEKIAGQTGLTPTADDAAQIAARNPALVAEYAAGIGCTGNDDTLSDEVGRFLGCGSWPTYGDGENVADVFWERLVAAAQERGWTVDTPATAAAG